MLLLNMVETKSKYMFIDCEKQKILWFKFGEEELMEGRNPEWPWRSKIDLNLKIFFQ